MLHSFLRGKWVILRNFVFPLNAHLRRTKARTRKVLAESKLRKRKNMPLT